MLTILAQFLIILTQTLTWILFAYVLLSWVLPPTHQIRQVLNRFVEPLLNPIRQLLPQTGPVDFSPIVLFILLFLVEALLRSTFF